MHPKLLIQREQTNQIFCTWAMPAVPVEFHFHSQAEFYLVDEGEVDVWVNRKYKRLHSGQIALALSYDAHRYHPIGDAKVTCLIVPSFMCDEISRKSLSEPFITNQKLFDGIKQCCRVLSQNRNHLLMNGCISIAIGLLLENIDFMERDVLVETDSMSQVLLYLHENFKNKITLGSTATALGFNSSYLSRHFKDALGINFSQYITMLRLREALLLLKKGEPISVCAYESGFNSIRTFYRSFINEFGCSPNKYLQNE